MRFVSILGDSISTYAGFSPEGYAVFYDDAMQKKNGLDSVYDTWWAKVNQALRAYLCVNNSYSGSKVSGSNFPSAVSPYRTAGMHTDQHLPDIILIYMGFNDWGNGVPVMSNSFGMAETHDSRYFAAAYTQMLRQLKTNYPNTKIVCGTLARSTMATNENWEFPECFAGVDLEDYNNAIRQVCRMEGCFLADIGALPFRYETLDGSHPTRNGHYALFQAWVYCLSGLGFL